MKVSPRLLLFALATALVPTAAPADLTINPPAAADHLGSLVNVTGDVITLNPDPVTYLAGAAAAMKGALAAGFPAWTFTYVAGLKGTLDVNEYKATSAGANNGGGLIDITYTRAGTDPAIADLHWMQLVDTNRPLGGNTTPYIDPRPNDDTLPFYWTVPEDTKPDDGNKTADTYHFLDNPDRSCVARPETITWRGELVLASWDGEDPGKVTVYDGIRWGWNMYCVPEPRSILLLIVGIAGLMLCPRARRRPSTATA